MHRTALSAVALLLVLAACSGSSPSPSEPESSSSASEAEASSPASAPPSEAAAASDPAGASEPARSQGGDVRLAIDDGEYAGNYLSQFTSSECDIDGSGLIVELRDRRPSYDNETTLLDSVSIRIDNLLDAMRTPIGTENVTAVFHFTRDGASDIELKVGPEVEGWRSATAEQDFLTTGTIRIEGQPAFGRFTATVTCYGLPLS